MLRKAVLPAQLRYRYWVTLVLAGVSALMFAEVMALTAIRNAIRAERLANAGAVAPILDLEASSDETCCTSPTRENILFNPGGGVSITRAVFSTSHAGLFVQGKLIVDGMDVQKEITLLKVAQWRR